MKIARIRNGGGAALTAVVDGDAVRPLHDISVLELLAADPGERERLAGLAREELALGDVELCAPIQPSSIRDFSVFEQHSEGAVMAMGGPDAKVQEAWYDRPYFFFQNPHTVKAPGEPVSAPPGCKALDLELEIAAVIGRRGENVRGADAAACIGGYTIFNDWSARDFGAVEARMPFGFHKVKDFAGTLGPWIVTADEMEQYADGDRLDITLQAYVNDELLGEDTLANMAFSFEQMVEFCARGSVVAPGDVIGSGTCGGGCLFEFWGRNQSFSDPAPLQPGDVVRLEVEGIGSLVTPIAEPMADLPAPPAATPGRRRHRAESAA